MRVAFGPVMTTYRAARWRAMRRAMSVMLPLAAIALIAFGLNWPPWTMVSSFVAMMVVGVGLGLFEGSKAANVYRCPACTNSLAGELTVHCVACGAPVGPEESHGTYGRTRPCPRCQRRFRFAKGQWNVGSIYHCTHCGAWLLDKPSDG
jgi:DNA-directed RNA polymerase subunit RPC12/RpoP